MKPKAFVLLALCVVGGPRVCAAAPSPEVRSLFEGVPLHFERNEGQTDPRVRFLARGSGYRLFLSNSEAVLALFSRGTGAPEVLRWKLVGATPRGVEGVDLLPGQANYLIGSDLTRWRTGVPLYGRVRYSEVYPGIGLTYYGNQRQLEYDLEVAPHADPRAIRFRIEGAQSIRLDREGDLCIRTRRGEVVQRAPLVYQLKDGAREPVKARFRRFGRREVEFEVAAYDHSRTLVIDPVVTWSVYLGSPGGDEARGVVVKEHGSNIDAYVVGTAGAGGFNPLTDPSITPYVARDDIFVTKLRYINSPERLSVEYSTYIGGVGDDRGTGIAVDDQDRALICASTDSNDLPGTTTIGPRGQIDVYVARLSQSGKSVDYGTRIGGGGDDLPSGIAVDQDEVAYVVGETRSTDYPTANGPLHGQKGSRNPFVSVLDAAGESLKYSTYLGGSEDDRATGVALDVRDINVVGIARSPDFDRKFPLQANLRGPSDAFVSRFTPGNGGTYRLAFSTFLGGDGDDQGFAIEADTSGVYVTGSTTSNDFPVQSPIQGARKGPVDAFVSKLRPDGGSLAFSTYLGGSNQDAGLGLGVDGKGYVYVTGQTLSDDFPVVRPILPGGDTLQGTGDAFLAKLVPTGCSLAYATYLGGKDNDAGFDVDVMPNGQALLAGRSSSPDFPTSAVGFPGSGAYQGGASDAFAALISDDASPDLAVTEVGSAEPAYVGGFLTYTITIRNVGDVASGDITLLDRLPGGATVNMLTVEPGTSCSSFPTSVVCSSKCLGPGRTITVRILVSLNQSALPQITNRVTVSTPDDADPSNDAAELVTNVLPALVDLAVTKVGPTEVVVGQNIVYSMTVTNNGPSTATGIELKDTLPPGTTFVSSPVCLPPVGGIVTCPISNLTPGSSTAPQVTILATTAGVITNKAVVRAAEPDATPGNDTAFAVTRVTVPGDAVSFFTVRSTDLQNLLEWKTPVGTLDGVSIHRTVAAPDCVYETNGANPATLIASRAFVSNAYDFLLDPLPVVNGTTYCYSIFVAIGEAFSAPRFNRGRPFDSVAGQVRWEFNIGTSSLAPIGNGLGMVHSVSNDGNLYAMVKGAAPAGGRWPPGPPVYFPFPMAGPSQGRPSSVPNSPGPPTRVTFLSSTDGTVYAIDADHGSNGTLLWHSPGLGPVLTAPPSASFLQFGATRDLIYVGSRDTTGSQLYGLRLTDGQPLSPGWTFDGGAFGRIGPVNGQAVVDYATHRVFFASRAFGAAPDNKTLWCVDFETGLPLWAKPYGDIDASLGLRGGRLYVATNAGTVLAVNASDGLAAWTFTIPASEGPAKGYVAADVLSQNLYFSTSTRVWSLRDAGPTFSDNWPPGGAFPPSPSTPVYAPLDTVVYVGGGDGRLYRLNVGDGTILDFFTLGKGDAAVGSPTLDLRGNYVYVGTEAGRVYAVQLP